jgi:hypothetical protein
MIAVVSKNNLESYYIISRLQYMNVDKICIHWYQQNTNAKKVSISDKVHAYCNMHIVLCKLYSVIIYYC